MVDIDEDEDETYLYLCLVLLFDEDKVDGGKTSAESQKKNMCSFV